MKLESKSIRSFLTLCLVLVLTGIANISNASVNSVSVTDNYPISHSDYSMNNHWTTERNPWNYGYDRIMMFESSRTDPPYTSGRSLVWGFISELKTAAAGSVTDYESAAQPVYSHQTNYSIRAEWSIFSGEENIIYGLNKTTKMVIKINVDKSLSDPDREVNVISYDPGDGSDVSNAYTIDWTSENELIVNFDGDNWTGGGYLINVATPSRTSYNGWPGYCTQDNEKFLAYNPRAIHDHVSLDRKFRIRYSASSAGFDNGAYIFDYQDPDCNGGSYYVCSSEGPGGSNCPDYPDPNPNLITHVAWGSNNDWYVGANMGDHWNGHSSTDSPPYISNYGLYQVVFDRNTHQFTQTELIISQSAGFRKTSFGDGDHNYTGGIPSPTLRRDNSQVLYLSTGGKYSQEDYEYCNQYPGESVCNSISINSNRSGYRVFLADVASSPGSGDTTSPTTPTGITATASSASQINLTWQASSDNVGVSGYKIYRDSAYVTSTSDLSYSNSGLSPSTSYSYTIVAFDAAQNESSTSLAESVTTQSQEATFSILKTSVSPIINGSLTEYASANTTSFSPASGGNTVTVKAVWDSQAIYLGIEVTDTELNASITSRDGSMWSEDSVEWFIDTYNNGGGSTDPNSAYMLADDYQGIINILNTQFDSQGTISGTPSNAWNGAWQSAVDYDGSNNGNSDTDSGYTVEVKIPWTSLGYSSAPSEDTIIGMSFAVNDKDSSGVSSIMWPNISLSNQNASNWQNVIISGSSVLADNIAPLPPFW